MALDRLESVRAILPPDGTDLAVVFGGDTPFPSGGLFGDDVPVRFAAGGSEMGGVGTDGFYERWADWLEPWESYRIYFDDVIERDDRIVCLVRLQGVTKRGRVEMEEEAASVFRFEGDKIAAITFTLDRDEALSG